MRKYFTYVNPYFDGAFHPIEYMIEKTVSVIWPIIDANFCVTQGTKVGDARLLGYIEMQEDENGNVPVPSYPGGVYAVEGVFDMIFKLFPHVIESVEEAKEKIERWTGRDDLTIDGDKVVIPVIPREDPKMSAKKPEDIKLIAKKPKAKKPKAKKPKA